MRDISANKIRIRAYASLTVIIFLITAATYLICDFGYVYVYTLDDPYIHLRVAENLYNHHTYGINPGEFSTPISSIIWPFLLLPFFIFGPGTIGPLLINIITAFLICKKLYDENEEKILEAGVIKGIAFFLIIVLAVNVIGLIFTGLEHLLHLYFSILLFYQIKKAGEGELKSDLKIAGILTAGILVRYEMGFFIPPLVVWFLFRRYYRAVVLVTLIPAVPVLLWGWFMTANRMGFFPNSIMLKTVLSDTASIHSRFEVLISNLIPKFITLFLISGIYIVFFKRYGSNWKVRFFIFVSTCSIYIAATGQGINFRYSPFVWSWLLLLFTETLNFTQLKEKKSLIRFAAISTLIAVGFRTHLTGIFLSHISAHNIYCQQYQMSRFAKEFINEPVALNDIGLVAYQNDQPILDLVGLGNPAIKSGSQVNDEFLRNLIKIKDIKLVIIYHEFFPTLAKNYYTHLGTLILKGYKRTPAASLVHFYTTDPAREGYYYNRLREFRKSLSSGADFILSGN